MRRKLQGYVKLDIIIGTDGRVTDARTAISLDSEHGLDRSAIQAAKRWRFEPATLDGQPVPVVAAVWMTFALH